MSSFAHRGAVLDFESIRPEGSGPAVVQLHGLTSSRSRDRSLRMDLGRGLGDDVRLLRYDARGHGQSSGSTLPDDYRWSRLADDLLSLLDEVYPGEQVHGCGPSMGTGTLLHAATLDPDRFATLSLVVPPTAWESRRRRCDVYHQQAGVVERAGLEAFVELTRMEAATPPPATDGVPVTRPAVTEALLPTVLRGAALADLPPRQRIASVDAPTLILAWTDDPTHPLSTATALRDLLPHARLTIGSTPHDVATWPALIAAHVAGAGETGGAAGVGEVGITTAAARPARRPAS